MTAFRAVMHAVDATRHRRRHKATQRVLTQPPRRRGDRRHCFRRSMMNDRAMTDTVAAPPAADGATSKQFMTSARARSYPRLDSHILHHRDQQNRERSSGAALVHGERLVPSIAIYRVRHRACLPRRCTNATWLAAQQRSPSAAALFGGPRSGALRPSVPHVGAIVAPTPRRSFEARASRRMHVLVTRKVAT